MFEKPMSVKRVEFINELVKLVNNSGIPPFVLEPILKDAYASIQMEANKMYLSEKQQYEEQMNKEYEEQMNEDSNE